MGKKSPTYKKSLRRAQKAKKRKLAGKEHPSTFNYSLPTLETLDCGEADEHPRTLDHGDLPPTPPRLKSLDSVETKKLQEKLESAKEYYLKELKKQEERVISIEKECKRQIASIRHFWKENIYKECTRGGRLLKLAMKKHNNNQ